MEVMSVRELLSHFKNYPYVALTGSVEFDGAVRVDDKGEHLMEREHPKSTIWVDCSEFMDLDVKDWYVNGNDKVVIDV